MNFPKQSRYRQVSKRAVATGTLGVALVLPGLAAGCGDSSTTTDVAASADATSSPSEAATATVTTEGLALPTTTAAIAAGSETTQATATQSGAGDVAEAAEQSSAAAVPAGSQLVIDFSYTQAEGGKNVPPYVAVWVEDSDGNLVDTVSLWYEQGRKGSKWLPDLTRWYNRNQALIQAGGPDETEIVSGATRQAGTYQVTWDGTTAAGETAPAGTYFLCVESAREKGPYSLSRTEVSLAGDAQTTPLVDDGELGALTMSVL